MSSTKAGTVSGTDGFVAAHGDGDSVVVDRSDEEFWATPSSSAPTTQAPAQLFTVPLAPAVSVSLASHHALSAADLDAVHAAGAELVRVLRARGLIAADDER